MQDRANIDSFIIDFAEEVGKATGEEWFGKLDKAVAAAHQKARIAKLYVVELLLTKSLVNYRKSEGKGDDEGMAEAKGVIKQQMDLFAGDGSGNQLGLREHHLYKPLVAAEKALQLRQ